MPDEEGESHSPDRGTITFLLGQARLGRQEALSELFAIVYDDLRVLARRQLNRQDAGLLQTTALVNAVAERMLGRIAIEAEDRRRFYFLLSRAMRDVLVEQYRARQARKRGGDAQQVFPVEIGLIRSQPRSTFSIFTRR